MMMPSRGDASSSGSMELSKSERNLISVLRISPSVFLLACGDVALHYDEANRRAVFVLQGRAFDPSPVGRSALLVLDNFGVEGLALSEAFAHVLERVGLGEGAVHERDELAPDDL